MVGHGATVVRYCRVVGHGATVVRYCRVVGYGATVVRYCRVKVDRLALWTGAGMWAGIQSVMGRGCNGKRSGVFPGVARVGDGSSNGVEVRLVHAVIKHVGAPFPGHVHAPAKSARDVQGTLGQHAKQESSHGASHLL